MSRKTRPFEAGPSLILSAPGHPLDRHRRFGDRRHITTDLDSISAITTVKQDVQKATPSHLRPLLADKARSILPRHKIMLKHEGRQRSGRASGRRIFDD